VGVGFIHDVVMTVAMMFDVTIQNTREQCRQGNLHDV
jgi:hypothetical protein